MKVGVGRLSPVGVCLARATSRQRRRVLDRCLPQKVISPYGPGTLRMGAPIPRGGGWCWSRSSGVRMLPNGEFAGLPRRICYGVGAEVRRITVGRRAKRETRRECGNWINGASDARSIFCASGYTAHLPASASEIPRRRQRLIRQASRPLRDRD